MYISKSDIEKYLLINIDVTGEPFVESAISASQTFVENYCGDERFGKRVFQAPDPDSDITKYFNGNGNERLYIGDIRSVTSLSIDGEAQTLNEDYFLSPLNADADGRPYTALELVQTSVVGMNSRSGRAKYIFEEDQRNIVVVGKWGYSETPPEDIKFAVLKLVGAILKENMTDTSMKQITSESLGDYSVSYEKIKDLADRLDVVSILAPYKRTNNKKSSTSVYQVS
jgi:hypothetical protein